MSSCTEPFKGFREKFPQLYESMEKLKMQYNIHMDDDTFTEEEASETLDRWVEAVIKNDSKETYDKIDDELLMIKRGIKGKEVIKNLEEEKPKGWVKGKVWEYLNCIDTGKTMTAKLETKNKGGRRRRRRRRRTKKKRRKRNLKKRTRRRRRKRRR